MLTRSVVETGNGTPFCIDETNARRFSFTSGVGMADGPKELSISYCNAGLQWSVTYEANKW